MPRHSKNATARQYFSYDERRVLKYGTITARLGADSQKRSDSCSICLETASDPYACPDGHLFCKLCIYENLVHQKQTFSQAEALFRRQVEERANEESQAEMRTRLEQIEQFALAESGMLPSNNEESKKADMKLKAFWLPSCTLSCEPDYKTESVLTAPNTKTRCPLDSNPLKTSQLRPVKFTNRCDMGEAQTLLDQSYKFMCPSCRKVLTASLRSVWLATCGHVVCKNCFDELVSKEQKCCECGKRVKRSVEWGQTGFSGSGASLSAQISTPAFQG